MNFHFTVSKIWWQVPHRFYGILVFLLWYAMQYPCLYCDERNVNNLRHDNNCLDKHDCKIEKPLLRITLPKAVDQWFYCNFMQWLKFVVRFLSHLCNFPPGYYWDTISNVLWDLRTYITNYWFLLQEKVMEWITDLN